MKYTPAATPTTVFERMIAPFVGIPIGLFLAYMIALWMAPVPIEVYNRKASTHEVTSGVSVTVSWTELRTGTCSSVVHRQLITADGKVILFEPVANEAKPPGEHDGSFTFNIPPIASEGTLIYRVKTKFICNWVQALLGGPTLPLQDIEFHYSTKTGAS